ncbi:MAG: hypothetical protein KF814_00545 [Nitrospiraceae bacterium]|nr:hypothetical protein [Nitrospiraceae bacterium]
MTRIALKFASLATVLSFIGMLAAPVFTYAASPAPMEIKVRVSEKGFADEQGRPYGPNRPLKIQQGTPVTLVFVFSENVSSLAVGDTHQIALRSDAGQVGETEKLWVMNKQSSISFRAGDKGQLQYRAYCILDCIGMEHLTNLVIQVVTA